MSFLRYLLISLLLISCTTTETLNYSIESNSNLNLVDSRFTFNIYKTNSENIELEVQAFPKNADMIENIEIVFDMKFRDDYKSEFNGVCVGPNWDGFGSGEFSILLDEKFNFKSSIKGKFVNETDDRCDNYFYYARYLNINMTNGETFYVGVATDYGGVYPDAPNIWKVDNNKEIELIFTSNIERYSINFELSK
ncbi:MAG: hypothetical protein VW988_04005 [Gammaproteobacteria bacterium]